MHINEPIAESQGLAEPWSESTPYRWKPNSCAGFGSRVEDVGSVLPISTHLLSHLDDPLQVLKMQGFYLFP